MIVLLFVDGASVFAALGSGVAFWLILGALTDIVREIRRSQSEAGCRPASARRTSAVGIRHVRLRISASGLTVLGIVGVVSLQTEKIVTMRPGETLEISGYTLRFEGIHPL